MENSLLITKTEEWFNCNVLYPRYIRTIIWSGVVQAVVLFFTILLCKANITNETFSEILTNYGRFFEFNNVIYFLSLTLLTMLLALIHLRNVKVHPNIPNSLWVRILYWLNIERLIFVTCFVIIYVLLGTGLTSLLDFDESLNLTEKKCVAERPLAMLSFMLYQGILAGVSYYMYHLYAIKFDTVVQLKIYTVKTSLRKNFVTSGKKVFSHSVHFLGSYLILGSFTKLILSSLFDVQFCTGNFISLSTIWELCSLRFIQICLVICFISLLTLENILIITETFLTEKYQFSLDSSINSDQFRQLPTAIKCDKLPIVKYHALLDLKNLSELSEKRRSNIYAVSLPGGHPHTWNTIQNECLTSISSFTSKLHDILNGKLLVNSTLNKKIEPKMNNFEPPTMKTSPLKLRNIADNNIATPFTSMQANSKVSCINNVSKTQNVILTKIKENLPLGIPSSILRYFMTEYVDKNLENAFLASQPIIWSVQALTSIVVASYREDKYGVVQWSLCNILVTFLELNSVLEKIVRPKRNGVKQQVWQMQQSLKVAVNNGLFRIVAVFHSNLTYLNLTSEQLQRLQSYKL